MAIYNFVSLYIALVYLRQLELRFSEIIDSMADLKNKAFIGVPINNRRLNVLCFVIAVTIIMVIGAVGFLVYDRVSYPLTVTFKASHFCHPTKLNLCTCTCKFFPFFSPF